MQPTSQILERLDAEDFDQAIQMTGSQRMRAGGDLFDEACRWTLAGIRRQFPGITPEAAMDELRRRLAEERMGEK